MQKLFYVYTSMESFPSYPFCTHHTNCTEQIVYFTLTCFFGYMRQIICTLRFF